MLRGQKEEKWSPPAKAGLITLGDPNCIKCAISDAAQAERPGLSVIILSAQLTGSSCNANRSRQNTNADTRRQWPHLGLYWRRAISKCLDLEPALEPTLMHPAVAEPPAPPRVPTRGCDFHDAHAGLRGTFPHNVVLQNAHHSLLWEVWQDLQVLNWYVKLGPVVGNHALTVVSGRGKKKVWEYSKIVSMGTQRIYLNVLWNVCKCHTWRQLPQIWCSIWTRMCRFCRWSPAVRTQNTFYQNFLSDFRQILDRF